MLSNSDSQWQPLGSMVDSGDLYLNPGVARRCAQRCAEFAVQLEALKDNAMNLATIDGLGNLQSGITLAAKFGKKAVGGDYSLDQAIVDHITIVQQMQQVFERVDAMYTASEERNSSGIDSAGAPLDR
ncbi:hypothetical protein ABIC28_004323 [Rhodococcus sp. PvR044]|uniref:hypothetical protein n=1 Tax=unclassified Rhodococcus (in: high G+C Gram-positive bacteria) TaxID=192944 RepID=UPI000BCD99E1|nr:MULTISPECIES: hypothetical protein [unclassified Rhodococcus (in: high G+C Gram-positive bacteria)]PTR36717.1 hypothetical protein C8K38_123110 [Rhodococcus sp. OK611]SNX93811.1 hypothetical protein SAMN05447004_123110 [Rhodococcus sp. OK270]